MTKTRKHETELDKNLKNRELTSELLRSSVLASKFLRETLWKDSIDSADVSNLKSVTKVLEDSISKILPENAIEEDPRQLSLEL